MKGEMKVKRNRSTMPGGVVKRCGMKTCGKAIGFVGVAFVTIMWCVHASCVGAKSATRFSEERLASPGSPYHAEPKNAKLLHEYGGLALFAGETEADVAFNAAPKRKDDGWRNSLFLRRSTANGKVEWRLMLTTGCDWKDDDGMGEWAKNWAGDIRNCLNVVRARLSRDGRYVWMVCNPPISFEYDIVCRFDLRENSLRVLTDGDSADEEPDGTIWVLNKKIYLYGKNEEPGGAAWIEEWITTDGEVVRKGEPKRQEDVLDYDTAVRLRRGEPVKKPTGQTR